MHDIGGERLADERGAVRDVVGARNRTCRGNSDTDLRSLLGKEARQIGASHFTGRMLTFVKSSRIFCPDLPRTSAAFSSAAASRPRQSASLRRAVGATKDGRRAVCRSFLHVTPGHALGASWLAQMVRTCARSQRWA